MSALKPKCDFEIICSIIKRNYGFVVEGVKKYDGYDNVNFRITTTLKGNKSNSHEAPQRDYVFKILNKNDSKNTEVVEQQHEVMLWLKQHNILATEPILTIDGKTYCTEVLPLQDSDTESRFLVQLLTHLPGISLYDAGTPLELLGAVGRFTGRTDCVLKTFQSHHGIETDHSWQLRSLPDITKYIHSQCNEDDATMGHEIIQAYIEHVLPVLEKFQAGILHGDVNNCNIIIKPVSCGNSSTREDYVISGIIDFSDVCSGYYVYELATIMAEIMSSCFKKNNPLEVARPIFKSYMEEFSLSEVETGVLKYVLSARLLQMYVLTGLSLTNDPENEYINADRQECIGACRYLWQLENDHFLAEVVS